VLPTSDASRPPPTRSVLEHFSRRLPPEPDPVEAGRAIGDELESLICRRREEDAAKMIYRALTTVRNAEQLDRSMVKSPRSLRIVSRIGWCDPNTRHRDAWVVISISSAIRMGVFPRDRESVAEKIASGSIRTRIG
jgi:hypothetical protein